MYKKEQNILKQNSTYACHKDQCGPCTSQPVIERLRLSCFEQALGATFAAMIGSGIVVRAMPYSPGFGGKQVAWMVHAGIMGAVVAPLCFLGGPILTRAAWYTAGVVGGGFV